MHNKNMMQDSHHGNNQVAISRQKKNKVKTSKEITTAFKQIPCSQANNTVTALKGIKLSILRNTGDPLLKPADSATGRQTERQTDGGEVIPVSACFGKQHENRSRL